MGTLESIGALSIIAVIIFLIIQFSTNNEDVKRKRGQIVSSSLECQNLIYRYNESVNKGKPIMTRSELEKRLKTIANSPKERERYQKMINDGIKLQQEIESEKRSKRKIGYKYENEIFEIFNTKQEMTEEELKSCIGLKFNIQPDEAQKVLGIWMENDLVNNCSWNELKWEVGSVLTSDIYKIDNDDMTRKVYLEQNNLSLEPNSKELNEYLEKNPWFD